MLRVLTAPTMPHMVLVPEVQTGAHRSHHAMKEVCNLTILKKQMLYTSSG
jgi:hypothetical protein